MPGSGKQVRRLSQQVYYIAKLCGGVNFVEFLKIIYFTELIAISIVIISIGLFVIKKRRRIMYGVWEIIFGIFSVVLATKATVEQYIAFYVLNIYGKNLNSKSASDALLSKIINNTQLFFIVATIIGGLYIIIRGLDNVQEGLKERNSVDTSVFTTVIEWLGHGLGDAPKSKPSKE